MSIRKVNQVSIAVTRKERTSDSAGGYTIAESAVSGSPFTGRLVRKTVPDLAEGRPGDTSITKVVLIFPASADIQVHDTCTVEGQGYTVRAVREYSRSLQADVVAVS